MHDITKYLRLPFQFDERQLLNDLASVLQDQWIPHFNKADYQGAWKVIPLYSSGGEAANVFAMPMGDSPVMETSILKQCPYFQHVVRQFEFPLLSVRLLRLGVGAEIKPHRDHCLGYEDHSFRLHIPITTNEQVQFVLDGDRLRMNPGECWYTNVNYVHSVKNEGATDRVHLVIDGKRNAWTDRLFFSLAPEESFRSPEKEPYDSNTIQLMLEELRRSNTPAAKELIATLEQQRDKQL